MPDDDPHNEDGLPNLEGLAASGSADDLLLGIELRLAEGPPAQERRELMLRAARLCASDLEAPERARGWLERFRAPAPQLAVRDQAFRELCAEVGAEELLEIRPPGDGTLATGIGTGTGSGGVDPLDTPAPDTEKLFIRLPTWRPFRRSSLINGAVVTAISGGVALMFVVSNSDGDSWGVPVWFGVFYLLMILAVVGRAYRAYLWPASQRVIELDAEELVIRDGKGAALHREPLDQLRPDAGKYDTFSERLPVVQLVGVGIDPIAMTCRDEGCLRIRGTTEDLLRPGYTLEPETWDKLVRALGLVEE